MNILKNLKKLISTALFKNKNVFLLILDKFGINMIFRLINKNKFIILQYHGISHRLFDFSEQHVAKSEFEKEIKYLIRTKYRFINLTDLIYHLKQKSSLSQKYVILTFDDGFKNVISNAYPIMKKYDAKGCLYIVTDIVDDDKLLWTDYIEILVRNYLNLKFKFVFKNREIYYTINSEIDIKRTSADVKTKLRSLSNKERFIHLEQFSIPNKISELNNIPPEFNLANWDDLVSLDKNILEIGCHSKSHPNLAILRSKEEFYEELKESKDIIENKIGYRINHLCYPAGSFSDRVMQFVKKFEYKSATTTKQGLNTHRTDLFQLKRIKARSNFLFFKANISGLYFFIKRILKRIL